MWMRILAILLILGGWALGGTLIAWWLLRSGFDTITAILLGGVAPPFVFFILNALVGSSRRSDR
ncbi:hypothetical protein GWK36_10640 [Caldichromatium japonicum]|uniref:Uncharacterized protein n=1 Tax=Caldichromatium japonicum TaxID=2699430 RepID=A0A6G7VE89_9GAMM|nr:hypothetical protein [Caldichromatium japonicum]QIK38359.1 hypothetical protein GWK36_10640 [Caldichromatium japonicum]